MKAILFLISFAFIVGLHDGNRILVPDAVGFGIAEKQYRGEDGKTGKIKSHCFFDGKGNEIIAIPSALILFGIYIPDNLVM